MHEAIEAFKEANDQERQAAQEIADQLKQAEADDLTLIRGKAMQAEVEKLQARVAEADDFLASYESAEAAGENTAAAVAMVQLLLAQKKELDDTWAQVAEMRAEIETAREHIAWIGEDDELPPDLA